MKKAIYGVAVILSFPFVLAVISHFKGSGSSLGTVGERGVLTRSDTGNMSNDGRVEPGKNGERDGDPQVLSLERRLLTPEEAGVYKEKVNKLLGDETSFGTCNYVMAKKVLDARCVPLLREMLKDPRYKNKWSSIASMLAWLSDKKDERSLSAFLDYVRRPDFAERKDAQDGSKYLAAKVTVIRYVGLFDLNEATDFLRKTFTDEGAREIVAGWYDPPRPDSDPEFREYFVSTRGRAAQGLVFSGNQVSVALVEKAYETLAHASQNRAEQSSRSPQERHDNLKWYYKISEAMADRDIIAELGREELLEALGAESIVQLIGDYGEKYSRELSSDDIVIIDPCPICGMTSKSQQGEDGGSHEWRLLKDL